MNWPQAKLESLAADVPYAFVGGPFGSNLTTRDYVEDGIPVIRGSNMTGGRYLDAKDLVFVSEAKMRKDLSSNVARERDLVFTQRGTLGQVVMIPMSGTYPLYVISQSQMKLTVDESKADPRFIYYYFSSPNVIGRITSLSSSSGVPHINLTVLRNFELAVPPLETQRRIADILSAYDDLIENNRRRIALLEQAARELYREWFVRFRFPGHESTRIIDGMPEGWERKKLGEVANITMGQSPKSTHYNEEGDGLPFHQGVADFGDRFPTHRMYCTLEARVAVPGEILFSVRAPVGRINITLDKIVIGRGIAAIKSIHSQQTFLFYALKRNFFREDILGGGTIFAAVTKKELHGVKIMQPTCSVIQMFGDHIRSVDSQIERLHLIADQLMCVRDLLLPRLMSGEVAG